MLPVPRVRALAALCGPSAPADLAELITIAESDPELTAALVRAANSAASAPLERIASARGAGTRLGARTTGDVLLRAVIEETFDISKSGLDPDSLWRHLVLCAVLTEAAIGRESRGFTAGMLHDVGRMAMASQRPEEYRAVVAAAQSGENVVAAELAVFGMTHEQWGALVTRSWGLPSTIVAAASTHHLQSASPLASAVFHARGVASALGWGDGLQGASQTPTAISLVLSWRENVGSDPWAAAALRRVGGFPVLAERLGLEQTPHAA
ncbi:MAG: HDOD domain-containing protein [Dehalococcoidia bacterium]